MAFLLGVIADGRPRLRGIGAIVPSLDSSDTASPVALAHTPERSQGATSDSGRPVLAPLRRERTTADRATPDRTTTAEVAQAEREPTGESLAIETQAPHGTAAAAPRMPPAPTAPPAAAPLEPPVPQSESAPRLPMLPAVPPPQLSSAAGRIASVPHDQPDTIAARTRQESPALETDAVPLEMIRRTAAPADNQTRAAGAAPSGRMPPIGAGATFEEERASDSTSAVKSVHVSGSRSIRQAQNDAVPCALETARHQTLPAGPRSPETTTRGVPPDNDPLAPMARTGKGSVAEPRAASVDRSVPIRSVPKSGERFDSMRDSEVSRIVPTSHARPSVAEPRVHIGHVEIVVIPPATPARAAPACTRPSSLASRLYLRNF